MLAEDELVGTVVDGCLIDFMGGLVEGDLVGDRLVDMVMLVNGWLVDLVVMLLDGKFPVQGFVEDDDGSDGDLMVNDGA